MLNPGLLVCLSNPVNTDPLFNDYRFNAHRVILCRRETMIEQVLKKAGMSEMLILTVFQEFQAIVFDTLMDVICR